VEVLAKRFYPEREIDLSDVADREFGVGSCRQEVEINNDVNGDDVGAVLKKMKPWKALGPDRIPNGLLKTLGKPLRERLAGVVEASLKRGYYPKVFRSARTVVLPKDKTEIDLPGSWRPIALLRTIGKTVEAIVAKRLTEAVERTGRLPEEQMGNRKGRSYEDALKVITELIGTAFDVNRPVSMLALDISGAFDAVNHIRLLDVLRKKGLPY